MLLQQFAFIVIEYSNLHQYLLACRTVVYVMAPSPNVITVSVACYITNNDILLI